jgi:Lar family restriction alleviation protein
MNDLTRPDPTLLPCPFCGGSATADSQFGREWWVECDDCQASTGGAEANRADAIAAWNRRVASACASAEPVAEPCGYVVNGYFYRTKEAANRHAWNLSPVAGKALPIVEVFAASPAAPAEVPKQPNDHLAAPVTGAVQGLDAGGQQK